MFGIAVGAFDGGEVWELVGNFFLQKLSENYERMNHTLYRDDVLAISKNVSGTASKKKNGKNNFVNCLQDMTLINQCNRKVQIAQTTLGLWKNHNTTLT